MPNYKNTLLLFVIILTSISCKKIFLGAEESNDPENMFEMLWTNFDEDYALFKARNFNWDSIYTVYRPQVTPQTTEAELWTIFTEMLDYLDDSHTLIWDQESGVQFVSGYELNVAAHEIFDEQIIEDNYLEYLKATEDNRYFTYGKVKNKDIGYISLRRMADFDVRKIDEVMEELKDHKAMIIDIRSNGGGEDFVSRYISSRFSDGEHYVYSSRYKSGPGPDDFTESIKQYTELSTADTYRKPVIILTNRATISAAEDFLLHMKAFEDVIQIGDSTAGDFSMTGMHRFLPNGWEYRGSIQWYTLPDGSSIDGIGHVPDVPIVNTREEVDAGQDKVFERGLQYLLEVYEIE